MLTVAALNELSRQLLIYGGFCLSLVGIVGSCANLYLFTRRRYQQHSCSLFILTGTFFDLIVLCIALLAQRTLNQVLRYDYMASNLFLCKTRLYLIDAFLPMPVWCLCLAAFNRYCITSRDAGRRQWCTAKRSRIMAAVLVVSYAIYRSPDIYYLNSFYTNGQVTCNFPPSSFIYTNLQIYFSIPVLLTTAPLTVLTILTIRTRANLRLFAAQQRGARIERQLTSMVLLQTICAACVIPYTINVFYSTSTKTITKSEYRTAVENLITQIVTLGFYIQYASAFYIYLIASSDVRRSVQFGWQKVQGKLCMVNRIAPVNTTAGHVARVNAIL